MSTISVTHLTKKFGSFAAIDDVNLEIPSGCVFGLLGPNGAGKTTTFKCLLGLANASHGAVRYDGAPLQPALFQRIAYVPERSVLYEWMRASEHLEAQRKAFARFNPKRASELMSVFSLDPRKRVRTMSKGMRTALAVVLAFAIEPEILVLDEPTSGLDPVNQRAVLNLIIDAAAAGTTTLLSSHQIGQVERAADRIAVLRDGKVVLSGTLDDMKSTHKIVEGIFPTEAMNLDGISGDARVTRIEKTGRIVRITMRQDPEAIAQALQSAGAQSVRVVDLGLEDIFLNAVDGGSTADVVEQV